MDRITSYISTISDYREMAKQAQNQSGQNWYDYFYAPLQESFKGDVESATKAIETAGNYDISSAYAQYLQSQRQLTSSNISSGDIARLSDSGYKAYEQAYQQSKYNIAGQQQQAIGEISSAYDKLLTDEEKRIDTEASMMRDIDILYGSFLQDNPDLLTGTELEGADLSKVVMGSAEQKELYSKIAEFKNSKEEGYGNIADYIYDKKGSKYFDYYMENRDKVLQAIGGLEYGEDGKTLKTAKDYVNEQYLSSITDKDKKEYISTKLKDGLTIEDATKDYVNKEYSPIYKYKNYEMVSTPDEDLPMIKDKDSGRYVPDKSLKFYAHTKYISSKNSIYNDLLFMSNLNNNKGVFLINYDGKSYKVTKYYGDEKLFLLNEIKNIKE